MATAHPHLAVEQLSRSFGPLKANDRVSLHVARGSVHAVLGENGAGKTTLMNILYGLYHPDEGRILIDGKPVEIASPRAALALGIGMVHQHFMLVGSLTVAENVVLGLEGGGLTLDLETHRKKLAELSRSFGFDIDPAEPVWRLPMGVQQRVEILKLLYRNADILILDEPTSVLTPVEVGPFLDLLRRLKSAGKTILLITHKLEEAMSVADRVTVMRAGRVVAELETAATSPRELARLMVGRDVVFDIQRSAAAIGQPRLAIEGLRVRNDRGIEAVAGVDLEVRAGEILGLAGVDGNGQAELAEAIAGLRKPEAGHVRIDGAEVTHLSVATRLHEHRLGYVPEDRQRTGLVLDNSVAANTILRSCRAAPFARRGFFFDFARIRAHAERLVQAYDVRLRDVDQPVRYLSGGNQQKVILAREIESDAKVLVVAQPCKGLDVGAIEFVQRTLLAQRAKGVAILYISTELEHILMACDRIAVIAQGRITGILTPQEATAERLGLLMAGSQAGRISMAGFMRLLYATKSVWAILAALLVGAGVILIAGSDPIAAYEALFTGAFFEYHGIATTLVKMSPLLLAGLAVLLPLRAGLFNIGAEGQIYLGALFATMAALYLPAMPGWIHILVCSFAGMIGGGLWALVPAYLKARHNINEVIVTLLMNYIGINLVSYATSGPMMEEGAPYPYSAEIAEPLWLPHILPRTDAHLGVVVGLVIAMLLYYVFERTSVGYSMNAVGKNPQAARYAGMSVRQHIVWSLVLGGALAGLAGAYEVLGLKYRLFHAFSAGYGYDGIVVAFLGGGHPLYAAAAALFLGGLRSGANIMQRAVGVPTTVVDTIQGLVVIFVAASLAFRFEQSRWAEIWRKRKALDKALEDPPENQPKNLSAAKPAEEGAER